MFQYRIKFKKVRSRKGRQSASISQVFIFVFFILFCVIYLLFKKFEVQLIHNVILISGVLFKKIIENLSKVLSRFPISAYCSEWYYWPPSKQIFHSGEKWLAWFLRWHPLASSVSITWGLAGNAHFWAPSQTYLLIRNSAGGPSKLC